MNLYLDDNLTEKALAELLRKAGHTVVVPADAGLSGESDPCHLEYAIRNDLVVLTADRSDFTDLDRLLNTAGGRHPGILIVRYDNDPKHDMKPKHMATAIAKVEAAGIPLENQTTVLNHWR